MIQLMQRWLATPVFPTDEDLTRRARLLNIALINILTLAPVLILGNALGGRTPWPVFAGNLGAMVASLLLRGWMRRGRVQTASIGLIALGFVLVTASVASLGTIRVPAAAMYLLLVITAGLLFDLRGMIATTALCSLAVGGLIVAENAGRLPQPDYAVTITQWIAYTALCGWTGSLTLTALAVLRQALARAGREMAERQVAKSQAEAALEALQNERDFAMQVLNAMGQGLTVTDADACFEYVNPAYARMVGRRPEDLVGKPPMDVTAPEDQETLHRERLRRLAGETSTYETRLRHVEGRDVPVLITAVPRWQRGQPQGAITVISDLTERKAAEEALAASEALLRTIAENYPNSYLSIIERDLTVGFTSGQEFKKQNLNPDQFVGLTLEQVFGDQAPTLREHYLKTFDGREQSFELFFNNQHQFYRTVPLYAPDGTIPRILSVVENITERKRAEESLRHIRDLLNQTQAITKVGGWEYDVCARRMTWTDEVYRIYGLDSALYDPNNIPQDIASYAPEDQAKVAEAFQQAVEMGKPYDLELRLINARGEHLWVRTIGQAGRRDGEIVRVSGNIMDITESKQAEDELRRSEHNLAEAERIGHTGSWDYDVASDTARWSENMFHIFDVDPAMPRELVFKHFVENLVHPADRTHILSVFNDALIGKRPYDLEYRIVKRDGSIRDIHALAETVRDERGKAIRMIGKVEDITARKRAEAEIRRRVDELAALNAVGRAVSGTLSLSEIAAAAVQGLLEAVRADAAFLFLRDGERLVLQGVGPQPAADRLGAIPEHRVGACFCGLAVAQGQPLYSRDIFSDLRCSWEECKRAGFRAFAALPLRSRDEISGVIGLAADTERDFATQAAFLETLASQVASSIHNAQLYAVANARQAQLRELAAYLQNAREEERAAIARELHDEFGQALTALKIDLAWLDRRLPPRRADLTAKVNAMSALLHDTIGAVRRVTAGLRPGLLDDLGLVAAIEWQAQEFAGRTGLACELRLGEQDLALDRDLATALFRIFQEALTNVARHAAATRVEVALEDRPDVLTLVVRDNGKGIAPGQEFAPHSLGLLGMRERARAWGGDVMIAGVAGQGTTVTVRIPRGG